MSSSSLSSSLHGIAQAHRLAGRREFGEVLASVAKSGRVVAVTSAEKAAAVAAERPGFWDVRKVL